MNITNTATMEAYLDHLEHVQRRSPQTVRTYRYTLNYWVDWLAERGLDEVRPQDVEDWARRERRGGRPAAHTMRREIVVVRTFHQWAAERGYGASMVLSAHAPTVRGRTPKPVPDELWTQVWSTAERPSDRLFLGLGYFCGLRRVEMVTLRPDDVDVEAGTMRFIRKGGSPEPIEYVAMGGWLEGTPPHDGFEQWREQFESTVLARRALRANLVWWEGIGHAPADSERMARRLRAVLRDAGLPGDAFTLHQLRHSCATNLLRAGCPPELIRDALSHSSWDVTSMYARTSGMMALRLEGRQREP
jgi:site-specific recombinase XerD